MSLLALLMEGGTEPLSDHYFGQWMCIGFYKSRFTETGRIWLRGISTGIDCSQSNLHITVNGHRNLGPDHLQYQQEDQGQIQYGGNCANYLFQGPCLDRKFFHSLRRIKSLDTYIEY